MRDYWESAFATVAAAPHAHGMQLNKVLFDRLYAISGVEPRIVHAGERRVVRPGDAINPPQVIEDGEHYRTCCPRCGDTKGRLWVSYHWCVPDANGYRHRSAIKCFNDTDCFADYGARQWFEHLVYDSVGRAARSVAVMEGAVAGPVMPVTMPDNCEQLHTLPAGHRALDYLHNRGIDPGYVANDFGVVFLDRCRAPQPALADRLIVPAYRDQQLVGWQGRTVHARVVPKYFTQRRMPTSRILYNFDRASCSRVVVITEGVADVWCLPNIAVATFGAALGRHHVDMIASTWQYAIVAYDEVDKLEAVLPAISQLRARIRVETIEMPVGEDPASLAVNNYGYLQQLIYGACMRMGLDPSTVLC